MSQPSGDALDGRLGNDRSSHSPDYLRVLHNLMAVLPCTLCLDLRCRWRRLITDYVTLPLRVELMMMSCQQDLCISAKNQSRTDAATKQHYRVVII